MKKKVVASLTALILAGSLVTSTVTAQSPNAKESLVALGDSITFGYNLGNNNAHPSRLAFPYLIDNDGKDFRVRNLGEPGWRSDQLLDALQNDEKFRQAVENADYITLNIGSNDLLQALKAAGGDLNTVSTASGTMLANLSTSISEIRSLTDAPIVVYNIYNPFQTNNQLHGLGHLLLPQINTGIANTVTQLNYVYPNIRLADANSAFGDKQATYVLTNGDIHPTAAGQEVLANLAEAALGLK